MNMFTPHHPKWRENDYSRIAWSGNKGEHSIHFSGNGHLTTSWHILIIKWTIRSNRNCVSLSISTIHLQDGLSFPSHTSTSVSPLIRVSILIRPILCSDSKRCDLFFPDKSTCLQFIPRRNTTNSLRRPRYPPSQRPPTRGQRKCAGQDILSTISPAWRSMISVIATNNSGILKSMRFVLSFCTVSPFLWRLRRTL